MSNLLQKLEDNRTPILLAEIGSYLHLIGRYSEKFLCAQAEDATVSEKNFKYQKVCNDPDFFENTGLDELLKEPGWGPLINAFKNLSNAGELASNQAEIFSEFIERHTWRDNPKGLCKILADAHGIVSGIDKALAGRGEFGKQKKAYTFRATAFGHEEDIELMKHPDLKKELFQKLHQNLREIFDELDKKQEISYENYSKFVSIIKEYYLRTIGETRRPINEISLYDYAHAIASLMKSNLAKMIIDDWYEPRGKSTWKLLVINIDILGLLSKGLKIGDILGYSRELEETFDKIKMIIEYKHPLGNEIYRDSTGIYFSCPDVNDLKALKEELIEKLKPTNTLDFSFQTEITDKTRSMVILSREREKSLRRIRFFHIGDVKNIVSAFEDTLNAGEEDICPVCRIRLKPERKNRCKKCEERYQGRARRWIENPQQTIWLDEVSDKNDRAALIVGLFDLRRWLSGEFIDTFSSQSFDDWKGENTQICQTLNINTINDLKMQFVNMFNNPTNLSKDQKVLCKTFIGIPPSNFDSDFWNPIAERDATGQALQLSGNSEKAKHLVKLLFRKHPSFARICRVWETIQDFINSTIFENILRKYRYGKDSPFVNLRTKRIQFTINPDPNIPKGATCDIDIDGVRLSPVCMDKNRGIFVTTGNLQHLASKGKTIDEIASWMQDKDIKIKSEKSNRWQGGFKITEAKPADEEFQNYLPFVKIYDSPDQFMALVPAYDALDIAKRILEGYEIQFSKVRDRLPFHLGIIAFHRRTPLYVAMDAGRRLIDAFKINTNMVNARIDSIGDAQNSKLGNYAKRLTLQPNPCYSPVPLVWNISYSTGDPNQQDEWHPYIRFNGNNPNRGNYSFDYTGNGDYVVHVKELRQGDCIKIEKCYFKCTFLENASERFRIDEGLRPLDDIKRLDELWNDIQKILKTKKLGTSQLYAYWQEVKKKQEDYKNLDYLAHDKPSEEKKKGCKDYKSDSVWESFVKSSLTNILKISQKKEQERKLFNKLFQATKDGLLDICLNWNLRVRKIKPEKQGVKI